MVPRVPRPEYPRPQLRRREWINLNGDWRFAFDRPDFEQTILVPFAYQSDLSGIGDRSLHDTVWYSRLFEAPTAERLLLHFGAVDYEATVWLNDVEVVHHEGGHTPFSADLTGMVRPGMNTLVVRADDPVGDRTLPRGKQFWGERPQGIFYTPTTGVWQTVWLEPLPRCAITSLRLWPRLKEGALEFQLETSEAAPEAEVEVRLAGRKAGAWKGEPSRGRVPLDPVTAWSPQSQKNRLPRYSGGKCRSR